MKSLNCAVVALTAMAISSNAENFIGSFTGPYFSGWSATFNDNPVVTEASDFNLRTYALTLRGATSPSFTPTGTASTIDFTHPVVGTGPTTVSFTSMFFAEVSAHVNDSAAFIVNGNVVQNLSFMGQEKQFSFVLNPGDVFGFRLSSDNDNIGDILQIAQVPEPSALVFAALGGLLLVVGMRNRVVR